MRIHRIHTDQVLQPEERVHLTDNVAHYLSRVLRVVPEQQVVLFNGDGADYVAEICDIQRNAVSLLVRSRLPARPESPLNITLVQCISRGERMDTSLQKATELGVMAIQPVFSQRSEVRLKPDKLERRMQHWRKVVTSACEQSGRAVVPRILSPVDVVVWARQPDAAARVALVPGSDRSLAATTYGSDVSVLVGPEGGFDDDEWSQVESCGVIPVSLGPRVLRTETAGPAAIAVLQAIAGDLA